MTHASNGQGTPFYRLWQIIVTAFIAAVVSLLDASAIGTNFAAVNGYELQPKRVRDRLCVIEYVFIIFFLFLFMISCRNNALPSLRLFHELITSTAGVPWAWTRQLHWLHVQWHGDLRHLQPLCGTRFSHSLLHLDPYLLAVSCAKTR